MQTVTGVAVAADDGRSVAVTEGIGLQVFVAVFGTVRCRVLTVAGVAVTGYDCRSVTVSEAEMCRMLADAGVAATGYVGWSAAAAESGNWMSRMLTLAVVVVVADVGRSAAAFGDDGRSAAVSEIGRCRMLAGAGVAATGYVGRSEVVSETGMCRMFAVTGVAGDGG